MTVLSGTDIRFLASIPFSNDYKNVRWFGTVSEQLSYFNSRPKVFTMSQANFQRTEDQIYIACNASIEALHGATYVMFRNEYYDRWFYAFVTNIEYVQRNCTNVYFEIDVMQTWRFLFTMKPSMVVREHQQQLYSGGNPYINTLDEGIDYGKEYDIVSINHYEPELLYLVIISKSRLHAIANTGEGDTTEGDTTEGDGTNEITASRNGIPQPLCYYVHPFYSNGNVANVNVSGTNVALTSMTDLLTNIYKNEEAVNNVVSIYVTEHIGYNPSMSGDSFNFIGANFEIARIADDVTQNIETLYVKDISTYFKKDVNCGNKYTGFRQVEESKLLMYPYAVTIIDDMKGNRFEIKNEYLDGSDLNIQIRGAMGTSNKVTYSVENYNTNSTRYDEWEKSVATLEYSVIDSNPNSVPIITDMLSAYLQGNRNSLENQTNSIVFNGIMGTLGSVSGGVAQAGLNPTGIVSGGVDAIQGAGNSVLALQGLQAKQSDINNTPPQLAQMGSNTAYNYGYGLTGFLVIKKQIKPEYVNKLTSFFKKYGYKLNEIKVPNFSTRKSWNFIQTQDCLITGNLNIDVIRKIQSVFDSGVTLWHTNDVGNYTLDNSEV